MKLTDNLNVKFVIDPMYSMWMLGMKTHCHNFVGQFCLPETTVQVNFPISQQFRSRETFLSQF